VGIKKMPSGRTNKPPTRQKYDYTQAEKDYIGGIDTEEWGHVWPTMADLAEKYGIPVGAMTGYAMRHDWTLRRDEVIAQAENMSRVALAEQMAETIVEFDARCVALANSGIDEISRHFRNFHKYLDSLIKAAMSDQDDPDMVLDVMSAIDLDRLGRALERFQKIGRLAMGQTTENTKQVLEEAESLKKAVHNYQTVFAEVATEVRERQESA
jgi:hypothetical protein